MPRTKRDRVPWKGFSLLKSLSVNTCPFDEAHPFSPSFDDDDIEIGAIRSKDGARGRAFMSVPEEKELDIPCHVSRGNGRTLYVLGVPWQLLSVTPEPGSIFSFNFIAADADEKGRYCWLGPRPGIGEGKLPNKYLDLYLE